MKSLSFIFSFLLLAMSQNANANLCKDIHDGSVSADTRTDNRYYERFFTDSSFRGHPLYNKFILECNRKRDTKGTKMVKIMTQNEYSDVKAKYSRRNLPLRMIRGKYNFFGNIFTQQKYRYALEKEDGVWKMTIPYNAIINMIVPNRVDFYMGKIFKKNPTYDSGDKGQHAWQLYERSQVVRFGNAWILKAGAQPIAETLCQTFSYVQTDDGIHVGAYEGMDNEKSGARGRRNEYVDKGKIQFSYPSYDKKAWKEGCRVDATTKLYYNNPYTLQVDEVTPKDWVLDNFIRIAEEYWTIPDVFELKLILKGYNEGRFPRSLKNKLKNDDYLKVRFGTLFMPYSGNQVYKTSLIQFNNFSTMTTDGTFLHEVGHAFGLDDEYGKEGENHNNCEAVIYRDYGAWDYMMCDGYDRTIKNTIYHYIATSRYLLTELCEEDSDCDSGYFCNRRLGANRCLEDGSLTLGESCFKNQECETNKCQGTGSNRQCVCSTDRHCGSGKYCNIRVGQMNRCLVDSSLNLGQRCNKNAECKSGKCQGTGSNRTCVCSKDSDCGSGFICKKPAAKKNWCKRK